jgi:excisionase family DNA binding protein
MMSTSTITELLTPQELAKRLKVPLSWVYKQTAQDGPDSMPVLRCGHYLRFSWQEVCTWMRSNRA